MGSKTCLAESPGICVMGRSLLGKVREQGSQARQLGVWSGAKRLLPSPPRGGAKQGTINFGEESKL